jgi:hypothetical protein
MADLASVALVITATGSAISGIILAIAQFRESRSDDETKARRLRQKADRLDRRAHRHDDEDENRLNIVEFHGYADPLEWLYA